MQTVLWLWLSCYFNSSISSMVQVAYLDEVLSSVERAERAGPLCDSSSAAAVVAQVVGLTDCPT